MKALVRFATAIGLTSALGCNGDRSSLDYEARLAAHVTIATGGQSEAGTTVASSGGYIGSGGVSNASADTGGHAGASATGPGGTSVVGQGGTSTAPNSGSDAGAQTDDAGSDAGDTSVDFELLGAPLIFAPT